MKVRAKPGNALTIDVEDYFQVAAFFDVISSNDWQDCESRVEQNTRAFMHMLGVHGLKATFFMLGWVAEKHPELVREIDGAGHEIACHGFSHQFIYTQSPQVFRQETLRAKGFLEDTIGKAIAGYRAASYSITPASLWALDIIAEAGFSYDSSIYPIRHDNYGLSGGPKTPYRIQLPTGRELLEFPITTARLGPLSLPVGGGGYFRLYPYPLTRWLLKRRTAITDQPFVFYIHPWELDPDQPRIPGASLLSRFRHYNNLDKVKERLEALFNDFDFTTMEACLDRLALADLPLYRYF